MSNISFCVIRLYYNTYAMRSLLHTEFSYVVAAIYLAGLLRLRLRPGKEAILSEQSPESLASHLLV